ncbi:MAG: 30S ribosomal protein S18 [Coxiellaceae bacterium]|jgi:small subunit ribosomal protein S18|nr:30S ribosomal protein S18 [Coxiellaceae bacterium]
MTNKDEIIKDLKVDYKNIELLKSSILENGRIISGRIVSIAPWKQRKIAKAIKLARYLALLPYTDQH